MQTREQLLLGDSTKRLAEIDDASVDLILTDPPYNTGMTARGGTKLRNFFDDRYSPHDYRALATTTARECFRILKDDRACYVFINWRSLGVWLDALTGAGFRLKNVIVWDKVVAGLNYQNYAHTHEFLIFAVKGRFFPRNKGTHDDERLDLWRVRRETGHARSDEFHHETVKPLAVVRRPIEHATEPGEIVCDPFMGSGTTCVAAKLLGRGYIGIELDPRYFTLAASRIAEADRTGVLEADHCSASRRSRPYVRPALGRRDSRGSRTE
jgi:DNA modification methylase